MAWSANSFFRVDCVVSCTLIWDPIISLKRSHALVNIKSFSTFSNTKKATKYLKCCALYFCPNTEFLQRMGCGTSQSWKAWTECSENTKTCFYSESLQITPMSRVSLRKSRIFIANEQSWESSLPWPKVRKHKNIINTEVYLAIFLATLFHHSSLLLESASAAPTGVRFPPDLLQSFGDLRRGHTAWQVKGNNPFGDQQATDHKQE